MNPKRSDDKILKMRAAGMSFQAIGDKLGISRQRVGQRLARNEANDGFRAQSAAASAVLEAYDPDLSTADIARAAKVSDSTALGVLTRHKLKAKRGHPLPRITKAEAIEKMQLLARTLGHVPTIKDVMGYEGVSHSTMYRLFGSWPKALRAAGLSPAKAVRGFGGHR